MTTPSGRLELPWTNKPLTLLAHPDGAFEWVDPSDYRVAEIRLLHSVSTHGTAHPESDHLRDNLLFRCDLSRRPR